MTTAAQELSYFDVTSGALSGMACGCGACGGLTSAKGNFGSPMSSVAAGIHSGVRGAEMLPQVTNGDGTFSFSGDRNIDAVLIGSRWTSSTLTFAFAESGDYASPEYGAGQLPFNAQQKAAARDGFRMIEGYTNLTITEVAPDQVEDATFRLSNTVSRSVPSAQGGFPNFIDDEGGNIWFGRTEQPYYEAPQRGNWGYATMLHEIGHTMGLKHGQDDYSKEDLGGIFEGGATLYGTRAIEYDKDGQAWSLMTYTGGPYGVTDFQGEGKNQAQTYMQLDIAALQYLYGANFTTQGGDSVYRWDAATGRGFINNVGQGAPGGNIVFETIWDGGGNDTYDLSNYGGGITVDLRPGAFSTFSVEQRADNNARTGGDLTAPGNIGNALLYQGDVRSLIENAIGGAGDDRITGNQVNNILIGMAGDDVLAGGAGNDMLIGGSGTDIADFTGATSGIAVTVDRNATDLRVVNGVDTDVLNGIEGIIGTAFDDRLTGDDGGNTLSGGAGGRDVLIGGGGDDVLIGGGYTLAYRDEADIVRDATALNRSIATAITLDGAFELAGRDGVSTFPAYGGEVLPHATVVAAAAGSLGVDYYSFTAVTGARSLFDLDATNNYTGLEILDATGAVIASNYLELTTDDGSRGAYDARLAYTFLDSGTYYVRVTGSTFSGVARDLREDQPYTLHVSLENAAVAAPVIRQTASATLDGGLGDDLLVASAGDDRIDGGAGIDTVSYANHFRGVAVTLGTTAQDTGAGRDTILNVENMTGTRFADRLTGNAGANVIDGGGGSDVLDGGKGIDTLSFASQATAVSVSLAAQGAAQAYRLGQTVDARGFENLTGGAGDDMLAGDDRANTIDGGAGDDVLMGDALGRRSGLDMLIGGEGNDTVSFATSTAAVIAALRNGALGSATIGNRTIARMQDVENITGGSGDDRISGNAAANILIGGAGNDILWGAAGDDRIEGGLGNDTISGGDGIDTAVYAGAIDTTIDLRNHASQQTGHGIDRLTSIENLVTGAGNDMISGSDGDNLFVDGGGTDMFNGRRGFDTLSFAAVGTRVTIDLSSTQSQDSGATGIKTLVDIEGLVGGSNVDYLTGSAADNAIDGGDGGDVLVGGLGRDVIMGGDGNDFLVGDTLGLSTDSNADNSADLLSGGAGSDVVIGGAGNDVLSGGDGDDTLSNGSFATTVFNSSFGLSVDRGNLIRVDGGDDVIDGGEGIDFAILAYNGRSEGIFVDVRDPNAKTTILSGGRAAGSIVGIEKLGFEGGDGDDVVFGGAGYDFIATYGGNDRVDAGAGDDTVFGGTGEDVFDGGAGYDMMSFATAQAGVTFDLMRTDAQDTGGAGRITATNFETVATSAYDDTIYLSDRSDNLQEQDGGSDRLYGRGGDDKLFVLRGGGPADDILLDGGDGNDDLSLLSFVNDLHSITMSGGAGDDVMVIVGALSATLDGGDGEDYIGLSLGGEAGTNTFRATFGAGNDRLYFNADLLTVVVDRHDTIITDFAVADDVLSMNNLLEVHYDDSFNPISLLDGYTFGDDPFQTGHYHLTQSGSSTLVQVDKDGGGDEFGTVTILTLENLVATSLTAENLSIRPSDVASTLVGDPSWAFVTPTYGTDGGDMLSGSDGRDRLFGLAGDDTLAGLGGDDVLNGGGGNDVLIGDAGKDLLYGGAGDDVFRFVSATFADGDGIRDFAGGDVIDFSAMADGLVWVGEDAFSGVAGQIRIGGSLDGLYTLLGDLDGDSMAEFTMTVRSDHLLTSADFLL